MCNKMFGVHSIVAIIAAATLCVSHPTRDELIYNSADDTAVVESTVRETRAVPEHIEDLLQPGVKDAYLHTYGDAEGDDGDVQGYSKTSNDKGSDGYKHFDSFHKKDGDKYGFETFSEYGKGHGAEVGAGGKSQKYSEAEQQNADDDGEESKNSYKVVEELNEDDKKRKAVEDYDGELGFYGDSEAYTDGDAEGYVDGGESENYAEGGDEESENYETESEGGYDGEEGDSGHYTSDGGDSGSYVAGAEYDDAGESQGYTTDDDY